MVNPDNNEEKEKSKETSSDSKPVRELTKEEQMELYEQDLKENDWGHRPC
jgi:hypothetical protein